MGKIPGSREAYFGPWNVCADREEERKNKRTKFHVFRDDHSWGKCMLNYC